MKLLFWLFRFAIIMACVIIGVLVFLYHLVTLEKVIAAHAKGLEVVPWTANTVADWDRLIRAGVDAIISDDPAALIAHLKQQGLR